MFLCTGNSCRSQIAEGFAKELGRGLIEPHSAGVISSFVHPRAIAVMKEAGIDISGQRSKEMDFDLLRTMDIVITLCGHAEKSCPATPTHIRRLHWPVEDPVSTIGNEDDIMRAFRRARDEIRGHIINFIESLKGD